MTLKQLHKQLVEAYSVDNLNRICLSLLNLYKSKEYTKLQNIAELLSDSISITISKTGKGFSKLMMLYHPDRALFHLNKINLLASKADFDGLKGYSHILKLTNIQEFAESFECYEDIDYSPVYEWDFNIEGFMYSQDKAPVTNVKNQKIAYNFYDALKIREYGHTDIEYPNFYLADFEEFELSDSYINDLDGVQFCVYALSIDVSNNQISDLTPLIGLKRLEELNLSYNQIGYVDVLAYLKNLKVLDLSNNFLDDISPLFQLEKLEYVNLEGNKVPVKQINQLSNAGITVDH
jgi:Leucine-rich repeat (LRR) protein